MGPCQCLLILSFSVLAELLTLRNHHQRDEEEGYEGKEALKKAFQEALQDAFQEAFKEAFKEALRVQELRSFVPLYGRDESFCHGGDGDRALFSQRHWMD